MKKNHSNVLTVFTMETCPNCPAVKKKCEEIAKELKLDFKVIDVKKDFLEALTYQVMETPSIALNDETIFFSDNPSKAKIIQEIKAHLN